MSADRHEEFKRRIGSVQRDLNGGSVDRALRLNLELTLELLEIQQEHMRKMKPIYDVYNTFSGTKKSALWAIATITVLSGIVVSFQKIIQYITLR